jgi:hypothetical protein
MSIMVILRQAKVPDITSQQSNSDVRWTFYEKGGKKKVISLD